LNVAGVLRCQFLKIVYGVFISMMNSIAANVTVIGSLFCRAVQMGAATLTQVFDSADQLERISAAQVPDIWNSQGTNATFDQRSRNKGDKAYNAPHCSSAL
jgi:hypothetical protein